MAGVVGAPSCRSVSGLVRLLLGSVEHDNLSRKRPCRDRRPPHAMCAQGSWRLLRRKKLYSAQIPFLSFW